MAERTTEQKNNFFRELTRNLYREGVEVSAEGNDLLQIKLDGRQLCQVTPAGRIRYHQEDIADERMSKALDRVTDIARITDEYMGLLESAPFLRVGIQEDRYRLLSNFNRTVLAGCQTEYGVQFVTWERSPDQSSLNHGHYYGPNCGGGGYAAAKQDFATRSGLISDAALFTSEQIVEIYRCVQDSLENNGSLTMDQESALYDISGKIRDYVPDLDKLITQTEFSEPGMAQSW